MRKKLDKVVVDVDWQCAFPAANVEVLSQHGSDHNPLFISCPKFQIKRSKIFQFQAAWMSHPDYESLVTSTWNNSRGDVVFKLVKIIEQSIIFNKDVFGHIFRKKK